MAPLWKRLKSVRKRWVVLGIAGALIALLVLSRPKEAEEVEPQEINHDSVPTMYTVDARSLVSDSGYTRYLIEAPVWYVFDEASKPNWRFDRGLYLEKYDDTLGVVATFVCDSAIYLTLPKIWEFVGNVRMRNESGDKFLTQQMFWDSGSHKIYSDSFIHIERADRVIEGYGFSSDERIEEYVVHHPSMILPISDFMRHDEAAPAPADSAAPAAATSAAASSAAPAAPAAAPERKQPQRASEASQAARTSRSEPRLRVTPLTPAQRAPRQGRTPRPSQNPTPTP